MNNYKKFLYFLFIFFLCELKGSCYDKYEVERFNIFNLTYNTTEDIEKALFGNMKVSNNYIYYNYPIIGKTKFENSTFQRGKITDEIEFEPWPKNNINKLDSNCASIIDFDIDEEENVYLLDEGINSNCPIKFYQFNDNNNNTLLNLNISIKNANDENITLSNFVIDKIKNYTYIAYYKQIENNGYEVGFFAINLKEKSVKNTKLKEPKLIFDEKYSFSNEFIENNFPKLEKKIINIALSCDGKYLFFCPLLTRKIYSVSTQAIIDSEEIIKEIITEAYKNDLTSAIISSNMRNLFFAGIENKTIYVAGQIDNELSIFDYKGFVTLNINKTNWPTRLSINNGTLYITSCKNIYKGNKTIVEMEIFQVPINGEQSYIVKCSGLDYVWSFNAYIIWIIFLLVVGLIWVFVFYGNQQDKESINKKND